MSLITFDGHIGAGAPEAGRRIARMLGLRYMDRLLLPKSALILEKEAKAEGQKFSDRFWNVVERMVSGFALGNAAGDPYFQVPETLLLPLTWDQNGPRAEYRDGNAGQDLSFGDVAREGNAVVVHRAGVVELADHDQAIRVGLFASWEDRVQRVMQREGLSDVLTAEQLISERESVQTAYFSEVHGAHPEDSSLYDICIDTSKDNLNVAVLEIARAARERVMEPAG